MRRSANRLRRSVNRHILDLYQRHTLLDYPRMQGKCKASHTLLRLCHRFLFGSFPLRPDLHHFFMQQIAFFSGPVAEESCVIPEVEVSEAALGDQHAAQVRCTSIWFWKEMKGLRFLLVLDATDAWGLQSRNTIPFHTSWLRCPSDWCLRRSVLVRRHNTRRRSVFLHRRVPCVHRHRSIIEYRRVGVQARVVPDMESSPIGREPCAMAVDWAFPSAGGGGA